MLEVVDQLDVVPPVNDDPELVELIEYEPLPLIDVVPLEAVDPDPVSVFDQPVEFSVKVSERESQYDVPLLLEIRIKCCIPILSSGTTPACRHLPSIASLSFGLISFSSLRMFEAGIFFDGSLFASNVDAPWMDVIFNREIKVDCNSRNLNR